MARNGRVGGNLTVRVHKAYDLRLEDLERPEPKEDEVQIQVKATGICGSDSHYYTDGGIGMKKIDPNVPMLLGHESAGIVSAVGAHVTSLKIGDRVAIEPGTNCTKCRRCKTGQYNLCENMRFCGSLINGPNNGTMREYIVCREDLCHPLPDHLSYEEGALIEPLSVAVASVKRTNPDLGSHIFVLGAGTIGLLCAAVARARGCTSITIADINENRLAFAKDYLGDIVRTINLNEYPKKGHDEDPMAHAQPGAGGTVMLIGLGTPNVLMPLWIMTSREINTLTNFRYANCYPTAISLVASNAVPVKQLVTHRFPLQQVNEAFALMTKGGADNIVKIQIGEF
ncbi:hypothetical protein BZG36_04334 [Bifiguratus adelaidae]|uniref:Enoyl reductase (ER) domain-containing protein n=1 Tax=Bifiguratus adelaidae TaxID=1938954 RepID=A0A261XW25_9FUNG|nr:hypothetical protein BZG36_04334 [Bifiguratus adelaidae]